MRSLQFTQRYLQALPAKAALTAWCMRAVARTILVAYSLFMLKPVMPVLIDGLAHTFWENVHIAVVHTVNGHEHVHYELRKAAADSEKDKSGQKHNPGGEEDATTILVSCISVSSAYRAMLAAPHIAHYLRACLDADLATEAPPPKQTVSGPLS